LRNGKALGKGLDSIISVSKEDIKILEKPSEEVVTLKVKTASQGEKTITVTKDVIESIKFKAVGTTDPFTVVYMELLRNTIPRFKVAQELGKIVKEYVERENPELVKLINDILALKGIKP